ncbi:MAG TPA: type II toxin-antitoxin system PemK/MazF family toxin [Candidatus Sericytochromatia bacterium]
MKTYQPSEVVLLSFPFSNATGLRRRPALVLLDTTDQDIIVARITSQITNTLFDAYLTDWEQSGLLLPSVVRVHKLATLEKGLVERKLGVLTTNDWLQVQTKVQQLWALLQ